MELLRQDFFDVLIFYGICSDVTHVTRILDLCHINVIFENMVFPSVSPSMLNQALLEILRINGKEVTFELVTTALFFHPMFTGLNIDHIATRPFVPVATKPMSSIEFHDFIAIAMAILALVVCIAWNRHEILDDTLLGIQFPVPLATTTESGGNRPSSNRISLLLTGASSGIGRATCGYLAENHTDAILYCGIRNPLAIAENEYPFTLPNVRPVTLDVTNQTQVDAVMAHILSQQQHEHAPLVGVICNAGIAELGTLEFQSLQVLERHYQINILGTLRVTRAALPLLRQLPGGGGRVVWITSVSALVSGHPRWGAYTSSKAALEKLGDSLRREVQPQNVSVSLVEPGFLSTSLTEKVEQENKAIILTTVGDPNQDNAEANIGGVISQEERRLYPHIYNGDYIRLQTAIMNHGGPMQETVEAIDHALFSKHPRTRYITSRLSLWPSWALVRIMTNLLPTDRCEDAFAGWLDMTRLMVYMQSVQAEIEKRKGYFNG